MTPSASDPIFQPLTINGLRLKNRVVRSSIGGRADYYDGSMSEARIAWERRFARGGVGAIISSNVGIRTDGIAVPGYASIDHDRTIPSWRRLIEEVHRHDCRYVIQLHFSGRQRDLPRKEFLGVNPPSSTDRPDLLYGLRCRRMTIPEIRGLVRAYADAARRARAAGADGIEIVACNGYILHQFLSGAINDRSDEYNGDLRMRARLLLEVLATVRAEIGRDFFVSMKLSGRDEHNAFMAPFVRDVGNTIDDTMQVSRWLAEVGLDAIHVSQGDTFPHPLVPAGLLPADDSRYSLAGLFYEGTRVPLTFFLMQFAVFRRLFEWNWGRRMAFKRNGRLLPEKIEGMNQYDAAKIKAASGAWAAGRRPAGSVRRSRLATAMWCRSRAACWRIRTWCIGSRRDTTPPSGPAHTATSASSTRCCNRWPAGRKAASRAATRCSRRRTVSTRRRRSAGPVPTSSSAPGCDAPRTGLRDEGR